jgi:hypothetical protein
MELMERDSGRAGALYERPCREAAVNYETRRYSSWCCMPKTARTKPTITSGAAKSLINASKNNAVIVP